MNKAFDNYSENFVEMGDFLNRLVERENNTVRPDGITGNQVNFLTIEQSKKYYKTDDALAGRLGIDIELLEDTKANTNIIVAINKQPYALGNSAWVSLRNRMAIYGGGFDLLGSELQAQVLNKRFSQIDKEVQCIIVDQKIRAIMSEEYAVVPTADLVKSIVDSIEERFETYNMVSGYIDHNISRCKILLPELKDELQTIYNLPDEYIPGIIIETSDTGFSANKIGTYWKTKLGSFINSNEYIYIQHKGNASLDKILDEIPNLFLKYQNTLKKFAKLLTIKLVSPVEVLDRVIKRVGMNAQLAVDLMETFETNLENNEDMTVFEVFAETCSQCNVTGPVITEFPDSYKNSLMVTSLKVLRKACKHLDVKKKITKQLIENFELNYADADVITAYDICREIFAAPTYAEDSQKTIVEEKVGKAINLNYQTLIDEEEDDN
jgi:hypothetical protein